MEEDGPNVWSEKFAVAVYRGGCLAIAGNPEFKKHFGVPFQPAKPDRAALDQVPASTRSALLASVRAIPMPDAG